MLFLKETSINLSTVLSMRLFNFHFGIYLASIYVVNKLGVGVYMSTVFYEKKGEVGIITIDSPPVNALNHEVISALEATIAMVADDVNVVIVYGAGSKAFVAGADIKEFPSLTDASGEALCLRGQSVFQALSQLKQPVIAAIDGFTLGGGLELALACDIRIASRRSQFGFPEVKLGILPGYGGTQRLPRLIGIGKAIELIVSGEFISAESASSFGLIERIVDNDVLEEAIAFAKVIASRGPIAVQKAKEAVLKGMETTLEEGLKIEAKLFGDLCNTTDKDEGVIAFLEKREAQFTGN